MVSHYPQDGHPPYHGWSWSLIIQNLPEGIVLQAWNLASRPNSQNNEQVTTVRDSQSPSKGWSPTIQRMVTHHSKSTRRKCIIDLKFGTWPQLTKLKPGAVRMVSPHLKDGHQPTKGWSPTIQRMVTHHPKSTIGKFTTELAFGTST